MKTQTTEIRKAGSLSVPMTCVTTATTTLSTRRHFFAVSWGEFGG